MMFYHLFMDWLMAKRWEDYQKSPRKIARKARRLFDPGFISPAFGLFRQLFEYIASFWIISPTFVLFRQDYVSPLASSLI